MGELDIGPRPATIPPKNEISGMMVQDVELGLKISTTLNFSMLEKVFMAMEEVDLGLISALLPPIIQVILTDHKVIIVIVMTELDIGLITANFLHINMAE